MSRCACPAGRPGLTLHDRQPTATSLCEEVLSGLGSRPGKIAPKWFYDERGARLFERICELEAYYPTRTEIGILERHGVEIAAAIGPDARLVEFGSGSGIKTRLLLDRLESPVAYLPIDISRDQLLEFALSVAEAYPSLQVQPICADYTAGLPLPPPAREPARTVAFFPGSTIGNFEPPQARAFLHTVRALCGAGGGFLIGIDLKKDPAILDRAYNDPEGVTRDFNLNLLERINRECGADFRLEGWDHLALYDRERGRIEMRLVSRDRQRVRIPDPVGGSARELEFAAGEHITTEYSYKFEVGDLLEMAGGAGWELERVWKDEKDWFALVLLKAG